MLQTKFKTKDILHNFENNINDIFKVENNFQNTVLYTIY